MNNAETNEPIFVLLGYAIFAWFYYKLAKKWGKKANDKYMMVWRAYVGIMLTLPSGMMAIMILKWLYSIIFGGG